MFFLNSIEQGLRNQFSPNTIIILRKTLGGGKILFSASRDFIPDRYGLNIL
uniref:Uncharacterized protein n=1 Tax=Myoviridae sp. cta6i12 TaxID=2827695 RepID=A0A8S5T6Z6_9CAUD|nr:MAG TPA: hypothetical protein [Myoviridae sp. cta6i12]DAR49516.1 MAG TPA: hypothetical protein [Caudoviricetes sp.]DAV99194.1 MAG TPA: hypothetical protein [Caudoviricetes sp.]DAZ33449.1 MAG TPA: hypothetical protein [Caudoviricetes sp.]